MKQIKNIIFDFGGVLVDWNPRYAYRSIFNNDEKMEWFLNNVCTLDWNSYQDAGRPLAEGTRLLQEEWPEYRDEIAAFYDNWETMLKCDFPQSVELVKELKAAGYKIYGLTNWSAETIGNAFSRFDVFKNFDGIVVSGEEKLLKPDPRIYRTLLERYNLNAGECVFIDDNEKNVAAGNSLGIHSILFDNITNVRTRLSECL